MVFGSVTNLFPPKFNSTNERKSPISSGILSRLQKLMSRRNKLGKQDKEDNTKPSEC